jgi:mono/diheme cytochrome c family protein
VPGDIFPAELKAGERELMSTKLKVFVGFVLGVILTVGVPFLVLAVGLVDWSAVRKPGAIETSLANWALVQSLQSRAPQQQNPVANEPAALAAGLNHYRENCALCHGGPDVEGAELAKGLNPPAPALETPESQKMTDGELFWIAKNGIRMTGMPAFGPTHSDQEIWQIVSFVRHLPKLSPEEKQKLHPAPSQLEHHHDPGEEHKH